jgi:hypothetical protein
LSYEQVPWYRSHGFAVSSFFVFMPALLSILFTGDVYYEKNEALKTYSKGTRAILIFLGLLSTLLIAAQAFIFLGGGNLFEKIDLLDSKEIKIVKNGTLLMCPSHTLDKMAKSFMGSPSWESGKAKDGTSFVNVSGGITYSGKPVEAKVQFTIEGGNFLFRAFEMNNVPSANIIAIGLLGKMCESAGGTTDKNESPAKPLLLPVEAKPAPAYQDYQHEAQEPVSAKQVEPENNVDETRRLEEIKQAEIKTQQDTFPLNVGWSAEFKKNTYNSCVAIAEGNAREILFCGCLVEKASKAIAEKKAGTLEANPAVKMEMQEIASTCRE